jgi:hypothetical protein
MFIQVYRYNANGTVLTEESGTSGTGIKHKPAVATTSDRILNLKNSIKNPMIFYFGIRGNNIGYDWYTISDNRQYQNDALWGGADNTNPTGKTFYPAAGYWDCILGAFSRIGSHSLYWSASISMASKYSYRLFFYSGDIGASSNDSRAHGFSVRCVKE